MIADVDYFVQKPNGKRGVLECKTSSFMAKDRWADDGVPRHYEVQGKHYLSVTNLDFCAFACLFGNSEGDFLMREIGRDLEEEEMTILELAYATTIHKSQGSEYHTVIIPILKDQYIMLCRNLIYTAVSRAKRQVILVGQKQALHIAIDKNDIDQRNTLLADRIVSYYRQMSAGERKNSA